MGTDRKIGVLTRRQFVAAGAVGGAVLATGCRPGAEDGMEFLTHEQVLTLAALCDQIIPADDFPSASQVGVLDYIDRQLVRHYRCHQEAYREGLVRADAASRNQFGHSLAEASSVQQHQVVSQTEQKDRTFFELLRKHTLEGYYGSPRHGGNRDAVSWRMLGLAEPPIRGRAQYDLRNGGRS